MTGRCTLGLEETWTGSSFQGVCVCAGGEGGMVSSSMTQGPHVTGSCRESQCSVFGVVVTPISVPAPRCPANRGWRTACKSGSGKGPGPARRPERQLPANPRGRGSVQQSLLAFSTPGILGKVNSDPFGCWCWGNRVPGKVAEELSDGKSSPSSCREMMNRVEGERAGDTARGGAWRLRVSA